MKEEKRTLDAVLRSLLPRDTWNLTPTILSLVNACEQISVELRNTLVSYTSTSNSFGDKQLSVDVLADYFLSAACQKSPAIRGGASEESPQITEFHKDGALLVVWDPLDGSSVVDCNWAVGTIIGIWKVRNQDNSDDSENALEWRGADTLIGATGRQQVASLMLCYGPRTTLLLALEGRTIEFTLIANQFLCSGPETGTIISGGANIFSPANLRATRDMPAYHDLVNRWMAQRYTLRYTGSLVPDVYQIFIKRTGVFCSPISVSAPAKLRLVFEVAPVGLLLENAGAATSDGTGSVLDVPIECMEQKTAFFGGLTKEVAKCVDCVCDSVSESNGA